MKSAILYWLCSLGILFGVCSSAYANHAVGGDIHYMHISDSTYKITVVVYVDCSSDSSLLALMQVFSPIVNVSHDTVVLQDTLTIDAPVAGVIVSPPCGTLLQDQCSSLTSLIPGIRKFSYSGNYTLPSAAATWRIVYAGGNVVGGLGFTSGRAAATNLLTFSTAMQLGGAINGNFPGSSPGFTNTIPTYFCMGSPSVYNPGITDPDGDSVTVSLVQPMDGNTGGFAPYVSPYTATSPLAVAPGSFLFSPATGNMSFLPNQFQRSVVVYNLEKRRDGMLIGSSQYEMTVLVKGCSDPCTLDIAETQNDEQTTIYPDPATDQLYISMPALEYKCITVSNALGQIVLKQKMENKLEVINTSYLPIGVYYLLLEGMNSRLVKKLVISR